MSSVSRAVGGSKTTLWAYFPSKENLFAAVIDEIVDQYGHALFIELPQDEPVADVLGRFAAAMLATMLSPPIIALHRLVTGETGRFPELGKLLHDRGSKRGKARLSAYFKQAMARGKLRADDPDLAAQHFATMCQANCYQEALFGIELGPTSEAIAIDITSSIDSLLRAWAPNR